MAEIAGLAFGVIPMLPLLAKSCLECYNVLENIEGFGSNYNSFLRDLDTERLRLKHWVEAWGLGDPVTTSIATKQQLGPEDYRYRYGIGILAQIIAVFGDIEALHANYGIKVDANEGTSTQSSFSAQSASPSLTKASKSQSTKGQQSSR